jgi:hypothetical protein
VLLRRRVTPSYSCAQAERHEEALLECCAGDLTQQPHEPISALGTLKDGKIERRIPGVLDPWRTKKTIEKSTLSTGGESTGRRRRTELDDDTLGVGANP